MSSKKHTTGWIKVPITFDAERTVCIAADNILRVVINPSVPEEDDALAEKIAALLNASGKDE